MTRHLRNLFLLFLLFLCFCLLTPGSASAGDYVNCQTCSTTPMGEVETEAWSDVANGSAFQQVGVHDDRLTSLVDGVAPDSAGGRMVTLLSLESLFRGAACQPV